MAQIKVADHTAAERTATTQIQTAQVMQAGLAALLGMALFIGVAFAHPTVIHNAAHDGRHGIAVPCH